LCDFSDYSDYQDDLEKENNIQKSLFYLTEYKVCKQRMTKYVDDTVGCCLVSIVYTFSVIQKCYFPLTGSASNDEGY